MKELKKENSFPQSKVIQELTLLLKNHQKWVKMKDARSSLLGRKKSLIMLDLKRFKKRKLIIEKGRENFSIKGKKIWPKENPRISTDLRKK
jgi:hypothetical protein